MTKEELQEKVGELISAKNRINEQIGSIVQEYINSLPYKVDDKVCIDGKICWIASIKPERCNGHYSGDINIRINPIKKDGTRSVRELYLWSFERDKIEVVTD